MSKLCFLFTKSKGCRQFCFHNIFTSRVQNLESRINMKVFLKLPPAYASLHTVELAHLYSSIKHVRQDFWFIQDVIMRVFLPHRGAVNISLKQPSVGGSTVRTNNCQSCNVLKCHLSLHKHELCVTVIKCHRLKMHPKSCRLQQCLVIIDQEQLHTSKCRFISLPCTIIVVVIYIYMYILYPFSRNHTHTDCLSWVKLKEINACKCIKTLAHSGGWKSRISNNVGTLHGAKTSITAACTSMYTNVRKMEYKK